jgi:hypothetical protein
VHLEVLNRELGLRDYVLVGMSFRIIEESQQNHLISASLEFIVLSIVKIAA